MYARPFNQLLRVRTKINLHYPTYIRSLFSSVKIIDVRYYRFRLLYSILAAYQSLLFSFQITTASSVFPNLVNCQLGSIYNNAHHVARYFASESENSNNPVKGIDLGTANSRAACLEGERDEVIENTDGSKSTHPFVCFTVGNNNL